MDKKEIAKALNDIEAASFDNTDTYWIVKAQLYTAYQIAQLNSDLLNTGLPLAGKGF